MIMLDLKDAYIRSDTNPAEVSPPPMEWENVPVFVPPFWADICPTSIFKGDETCSGNPEM